jgi:hypothetical protein
MKNRKREICARNVGRNFGRPCEQIVEEAAAQVENLLFNKPLSDSQNLFQRFNPEHPQSNGHSRVSDRKGEAPAKYAPGLLSCRV